MAEKKVYFYAINVYEANNERLLPIESLKMLICDIINTHSVQLNGYKTLDISTVADDDFHIMMDIFDYENESLFCRLSKQKPNNSILRRDYATSEYSDVFSQNEVGNNGIEIFTYGKLDYRSGLFAYVSSQSAPDERSLLSVFEKYNRAYKIELLSIANPDGINAIYYGHDPQISKIEVTVARPTAEMLDQIFDWNDDEITHAVSQNALTAKLIVSSPIRGKLVDNEEALQVIDRLRSFRNIYNTVKVVAKSQETKLQEYNLYAKYFSYPIDIPKYRIINNKRVEYTLAEITDMYKHNLHEAFETNKPILQLLVGRDE